MTHTAESLMALVDRYRDLKVGEGTAQARAAILAALAEALQERDTAQGMATAWKLTHDKVLAAATKGAV